MNRRDRNFLTLIFIAVMVAILIAVIGALYQISFLPILGMIIMFTAFAIFFYNALSPRH